MTVAITFRLTVEEREQLKRAAHKEETTLQGLIYNRVFHYESKLQELGDKDAEYQEHEQAEPGNGEGVSIRYGDTYLGEGQRLR